VSFASRGALVDGPRAASVFGLSLLAAVLWPLRENWRAARRDSFPLSYYPMFSARRRSASASPTSSASTPGEDAICCPVATSHPAG